MYLPSQGKQAGIDLGTNSLLVIYEPTTELKGPETDSVLKKDLQTGCFIEGRENFGLSSKAD